MKRLLTILLLTLTLTAAWAEQRDDWQPIGEWPFEYQTFQVATIYSGIFSVRKTQTPCNIHLGKQALWYSQNDTLMEAVKGTILRVEFNNGDVFIPVNGAECLGKVIQEDSLVGKVARVIEVRLVDQKEVDKRAVELMNLTSNLQQSSLDLGTWGAQLSDINSVVDEQKQPLPLINVYYFQYNGEIFEATEKQILKRIDQSRRKEFRRYTREAEIISTNRSSVLKEWNDFFVHYTK